MLFPIFKKASCNVHSGIIQQVNQEINSKVYHCFYFKLYHVGIAKYDLQCVLKTN
jgi:hypothetical protein